LYVQCNDKEYDEKLWPVELGDVVAGIRRGKASDTPLKRKSKTLNATDKETVESLANAEHSERVKVKVGLATEKKAREALLEKMGRILARHGGGDDPRKVAELLRKSRARLKRYPDSRTLPPPLLTENELRNLQSNTKFRACLNDERKQIRAFREEVSGYFKSGKAISPESLRELPRLSASEIQTDWVVPRSGVSDLKARVPGGARKGSDEIKVAVVPRFGPSTKVWRLTPDKSLNLSFKEAPSTSAIKSWMAKSPEAKEMLFLQELRKKPELSAAQRREVNARIARLVPVIQPVK
jgi:hypothetical protein